MEQIISIKKTSLAPIGQLLTASWKFFKANLNKLLLITLILMSPSLLNQILVFLSGQNPNPVIGVIMVILGLFSIVTGIWGTIALITFINEKNPALSISEAFNKNLSLFWSYLWASIIVGVITLLGFILLIIPGFIIAVYFSFFSYVLVCEKIKGYGSAKKSLALVKNYWWPVLSRLIVVGLIFIGLMLIFTPLIFLNQTLYSLIVIILSLLFSPFATIYSYNLYQNLKEIKKSKLKLNTPVSPS